MEKYRRFGIWECKEPVYVRFTYYSSQGLARYNLDLVCVEEVNVDKGGTERLGNYIYFYGKRSEKHQFGTGFLYITK